MFCIQPIGLPKLACLFFLILFSLQSCDGQPGNREVENGVGSNVDNAPISDVSSEVSGNVVSSNTENDTSEQLISTTELANAGFNNEIPILTPRTIITGDTYDRDINTRSLSHDGSRIAILNWRPTTNNNVYPRNLFIDIYSTLSGDLLQTIEYDVGESVYTKDGILVWGNSDVLHVVTNDPFRRNGVHWLSFSTTTGSLIQNQLIADAGSDCSYIPPTSSQVRAYNAATDSLVYIAKDRAEIHYICRLSLSDLQFYKVAVDYPISNRVVVSTDGSLLSVTERRGGTNYTEIATHQFDAQSLQAVGTELPGNPYWVMMFDPDHRLIGYDKNFYLLPGKKFIHSGAGRFQSASSGNVISVRIPSTIGDEAYDYERYIDLTNGRVIGDAFADSSLRLISADGSTAVVVSPEPVGDGKSVSIYSIYSLGTRTVYTAIDCAQSPPPVTDEWSLGLTDNTREDC